jgi:glycerophosphoryl diester phosphodiesterase
MILGALIPGTTSSASPLDCDQLPDPNRWADAGSPDTGLEDMVIAAHRGAAELAPENTLDAYRYAIAYGVDMIEVDVQQTLDGRYVSFHDSTVDAKTDGTGNIALMTYDEVRTLNAAANEKWVGSEYDPAQIPSLEEILELARDTGTGIYFDIKESVTHPVGVAEMADRYGLVEPSAFLTYEPARAALIRAAYLDAPIMLSNPDPTVPPEMLYLIGQDYKWFGSSLPNYSPEKIAAIHDACGLVIPNVYQGDITDSEAGDLLHARSIGADGAQVNNPDVVADALNEPVDTKIEVSEDGGRACLLDADHGFGLPLKGLEVQGITIETRRDGCAPLPDNFVAGVVRFAGDGSALASRITHTP